MTMPVGDLLPELILLGGAVVVLIFALVAPRRIQLWAAALAAVVLAGAMLATITLLDGPERLTFSGTYAVDGVALWGKLIVCATTVGVVALSVEWFASDPRHGEYYALLLLSTLGAALLAGAADLMQLTLAMLLASTTSAVLIAYHRRSRRAGEAAIKFYLLGALTNGALVFGVVLLFGLSATTTFEGLHGALARLGSASLLPLVIATGLVLVGLAFELGAVPAHAWLPDVAEGAPAPVAAFVTAVPKIGALIALARLVDVLPEGSAGWRPLVAILAAVTMTLGNVAALWQNDVRRLLGWSAVSQTGYGLMAIVALGRSPLAVPALLYFLAAYALATVAAFGVVVMLRGQADRARYAGLAAAHPWLALALLISFLSYVGIPPLAGFAAKLALFGAVIDAGYGWLAALAVANTVVSVFYYVRVLAPVYFDEPQGAPLPRLGSWAASGVAIATAAIVLLGVWANGLLGAVRAARVFPG
ncbi:MAG: NADH-quinone oxidoreductase subunit N [Gemmatimonadota bacterium]|nr:NADH-quinone oxidoreductase subunit N [Gemmatimonadota bacterium]